MKILIVHNAYRHPGGEDQVVASETALLRAHGHQVITYHQSNRNLDVLSFQKKIKTLFIKLMGDKMTQIELNRILLEQRPDIVHLHNAFFMIGPAVFLACRTQRVPLVWTIHNFRFMTLNGILFPDSGKWRAFVLSFQKGFLYKWMWLRFWKARRFFRDDVRRFIVLSRFGREKFLACGFDPARTVIKPNFLDFDPGQRTTVGNNVLFVGSFQSYKGVRLVERAARRLSHIAFTLIGDGPLRCAVESRGGANLQCLGQLDLKTTIAKIRECAFVIVPSLCHENFPRVVVEAFACGVPVLASRRPPLTELIEDGKTGWFFDPGVSGDLEDKIQKILTDIKGIARAGVLARVTYENQFTSGQNYQAMMNIYQSVLTEVRENQSRG